MIPSLVFDVATNLCHERAYLNNVEFEQHLMGGVMFAFGKHLVGDRRNGNVYEFSQDIFSDNGDPIRRDRIFTHLNNENQLTT